MELRTLRPVCYVCSSVFCGGKDLAPLRPTPFPALSPVVSGCLRFPLRCPQSAWLRARPCVHVFTVLQCGPAQGPAVTAGVPSAWATRAVPVAGGCWPGPAIPLAWAAPGGSLGLLAACRATPCCGK